MAKGELSACWLRASGSVYSVVVLIPYSEAVLPTRRAISPLLAIRIDCNGFLALGSSELLASVPFHRLARECMNLVDRRRTSILTASSGKGRHVLVHLKVFAVNHERSGGHRHVYVPYLTLPGTRPRISGGGCSRNVKHRTTIVPGVVQNTLKSRVVEI